jgi:putative membrane protein
MRILLYIVFLLIILLGISFAYLNANSVTFNYYLGERTMPLSLLLICSFGVGLILGFVVVFISWIRLKVENIRLKKRLKSAKQEIENLRAIPIQDKI